MKVCVVSIYPQEGPKHAGLGGVASYTKKLASSLMKHTEVTVFADEMPHKDTEHNEGAMVCRCWNKGIIYPFQIFKRLLKNETDIVHVQHEIFLYGGLGSAAVFPLLLFLIRLLRKPLIVTFHGAIPLFNVDGQFLRDNGIKGNPTVMKLGLISLVRISTSLSTSTVVHEEKFKEILVSEYGCPFHKIHVIPHGIEATRKLIEKDRAKEKLGLAGKNVVLFFGYVTGYKNVELLIECADFLKTPDWCMVIAGGLHPRLRDDPNYSGYLSELFKRTTIKTRDKILFKGFIPEEDVPLYFSATDLVIFPYKIAMSSSGPMCIAVSFRAPFLISEDFSQIVKIRELIFRLDPRELARNIDAFFQTCDIRRKALKYIEQLAVERSWDSVAKKTIDLYEKRS